MAQQENRELFPLGTAWAYAINFLTVKRLARTVATKEENAMMENPRPSAAVNHDTDHFIGLLSASFVST